MLLNSDGEMYEGIVTTAAMAKQDNTKHIML